MLSWLRRRLGRSDFPGIELPEPTALARASTAFAAALIARQSLPDNAVVGPLSTFDLLAQLAPFASGTTQDELKAVLGTIDGVAVRRQGHLDEPDITIRSATGLFAAQGVALHPELAPAPGLHVEQLSPDDPAERVNAWVSAATAKKIPRIISPTDAASLRRLILVDTLYFDGKWQHPFAPERTALAAFHAPGGTVDVRTMNLETPLFIAPDDGPPFVSLPYRGRRFALDVVMGIEPSDIDTWQSRRRRARRRMTRLSLPRFSIAPPALDLREAIEAMGLPSAFDPARASFPGLSPDPIWLDRLVHRARIDVDEEGTVAAAATAGLAQQSRDPQAVPLRIDRPFSFFLHDATDPTLLFVGRVSDPGRN